MKTVKLGEVLEEGFSPKFTPLTFISTDAEIKRQLRNTISLYNILKQNNAKISRLGDIIKDTQYGYTASASDIGKYKLLRITDIKDGKVDWKSVPFCECDSPEKYLLEKNDILIARTGGTTGKSFLINDEPINSVFASYLIRMRTGENLLPEYLYIFLNSYYYWYQISEMKMGTAQPNVNAEKLKELLIPFCNIEIQKSIIQENDDFSDNQIIKSYDKINSLQSLISSQLDLLKKYRQAILQDAIQGKLVKQDKNDEPASVLLEKIKKEKQKLITEGKLKADKELTPIHPDEVPFEIPKNWVWCRLGDVSLKVQDGTHFSPSMQYDVPEKNRFLYITSKNIKDYGIEMFGATYIDKETHESIYQRCNVEKGDLLIIKDGAITGRVTINNIDEPFSLLSSVAFVKSFNQYIDNKYIMYYLRSDVGREKIIGRMTGSAMPRIILEKIKSTILPLPPLAEQKRIVARVDELMTLCDTMEGKLKEDKALSEKMMEAVLQEAFGVKDNDIIRQDVKKR